MFKIFILFLFFSAINLNAEEEWVLKYDIEAEDYKGICCPDSNHCFLFTVRNLELMNYVYKSTDQGVSWDVIYTSVYDLDRESYLGECLAVDSNNIFLKYTWAFIIEKSTDGGKTFKRIDFQNGPEEYKGYMREINMFDENRGVIVSSHEIFYTTNAWDDYGVIKHGQSKWFIGFCHYFLDSANAIIPIDTDSCQVFMKLNIETGQYEKYGFLEMRPPDKQATYILKVSFINDSLGFACGGRYQNDSTLWGSDQFWKTTNHGKSWISIFENTVPLTNSPYNIKAMPDGRIFAVGEWGKAMESTDFGETWTYLSTPVKYEQSVFGLFNSCDYAGSYKLVSSIHAGVWRYEDPSAIYDMPTGPDIRLWSSKGRLHIDCPGPGFSQQNHISISDISGRVVHEQNISSESTIIDISSFAKAVYLYRISSGNRLLKSGSFVVGE